MVILLLLPFSSLHPPLSFIYVPQDFSFFPGLQWEGEKRNLDFLAVKTSREKSLVDPWGLLYFFFVCGIPHQQGQNQSWRRERKRELFSLSRERREAAELNCSICGLRWGGRREKGQKKLFFPGKGKMLSSSPSSSLHTGRTKGKGGAGGKKNRSFSHFPVSQLLVFPPPPCFMVSIRSAGPPAHLPREGHRLHHGRGPDRRGPRGGHVGPRAVRAGERSTLPPT